MANVAEEIGGSQVIKNPPERVVVFYLLKYLIFSPFSIPGNKPEYNFIEI
ncbi:hypothetical protein [Morganella morganii IS15]|nr:hypothetical protein CSB69_2715 [Morganella morganii]EMP49828.1 hypothetical protein C790_03334 [Morganella morganii SC01]CDK66154.1 hypothetical protein [Morganella morganii IS15]